jgi:hypothetical protein
MTSSHPPLPSTGDTAEYPRMAVRAVAVLAAVTVLSGCSWRSYERVLTVHLEVLSSMATKLLDTAAAGQRPSPNEITELLYPLHRARQFVQQYASYSERASYREFVTSLDFYEKLVDEVDAARADDQRWQARRAKLKAPAEAFLDQARRTREALNREK